MLKKTLFFLLSFLLSQSIAWASIVSINNTKYTATRSYGINSTDNSEETTIPGVMETSGAQTDGASGGEYADGGESTEPDIPEPENDTYGHCYFNCLDVGAVDCAYTDIGSITVDTDSYCTCPDTGANVLLCDDSVFGSPDTVNYASYPRGFGMSKNPSLSLDSNTGQYHQYFYYLSNLIVGDFCPVVIQDSASVTISALSTSYYNNAKSINCSNPLFGLSLIKDPSYGIQSCLPPQAVNNNQNVSICVYEPTSADIEDYRNNIDYTRTGNDTGLENCASKINKLTSSGSRSLYAMNDNSDIPNNAQDYYYLYQPDSSYSAVGDYYATECFINCGTSTAPIIGQSYDISPYCQGYYYLPDCNNFMSEESNNYYLSNTYKEYINGVTEHAFSGMTEICYDSSNNIKMSFVRCGLKHSVDSTHGVYKESECNLGNGTCNGVTGAYTCDGDNYCSKCTCNSNLVTLAQWCAASGITTNCNTDNYVHYGNVCNYDSELKAERWVLQSCSSENQYLAVADTGSTYAQLKTGYGTGIKAEYCYDNGALKWQVTCDSDYNMLCYPTATSTEDWCIHGHNDETTMRSEAQSANPGKYCQVNTVNQGVCGASVLLSDGTILTPTNDIKIYKVSSADECYAKFGKAATAQVCSASAGSSDIDGFNCYYDLRAFKYSTNTANGAKLCEVRHDLRGDYVLYNGQKRWAECNCVDLYKYSVYNCSGSTGSAVLSGNACKQDLSNVNYSASLIEKWRRAGLPYDATHNQITISSVNLHPYCKCKPGINYTCDTNPGRIEGDPSGDTCVVDGKTYYSSCICHPDDLPDNWADSYFGCPSGSKPTEVWKDNGCGQKIYQCSSTIACTDEYTETCDGVGEVGDGQGCQDNEGNYVRWKACKCSSEYSYECTENNEGVGEACTADGGEKYTACGCPADYQACDAPASAASGATICMMINMNGQSRTAYYSSCSCPLSYTSCSTDGQIGDTNFGTCVSSGITLYEKCKCPDSYENCSNPSDTDKYRPITSIPNAYTGVTTSGYGSCKLPTAWTAYVYQECKCNDEIFKSCEGNGATPYGVSCKTDNDSVTLYTNCRCGSDYTDQCLASEGKVVNPARDYDYCQIGDGEKYYKPDDCLCEAEGWQVCDAPGQSGIGAGCVIGQAGAGNPIKHAVCACENSYLHQCSGNGLDLSLSSGCTTSSGVTTYSACSCSSGYDKTCSETGMSPSNPSDYCEIDGVKQYASCSCSPEYQYTCTELNLEPVNASDFCDDHGTRKYKACKCSAGYNATCDEPGQVPPDVNDANTVVSTWNYSAGFCELNGTKYYKTCKCAAGMQRCGGAYGSISGGTVCYDQGSKDDDGNWFGGTKYYSQCGCGEQYMDCSSLGGTDVGTASGASCVSYSGDLHRVNSRWEITDVQTVTGYTKCLCPTHKVTAIVSSLTQQSGWGEDYYVASSDDCLNHHHNTGVASDTVEVTCNYDDSVTCVNYNGTATETRHKCTCYYGLMVVPGVEPDVL